MVAIPQPTSSYNLLVTAANMKDWTTYRRDHPSWRHTSEQQVDWDLTNNVTNSEDRSTSHQLISVHLQVLFHATQVGIGDILKVQIFQEVPNLRVVSQYSSWLKAGVSDLTYRSKCQHKCIKLEQQSSLVLWILPRIPEISFPRLDGFHQALFVSRIRFRIWLHFWIPMLAWILIFENAEIIAT